MARLLFVSAHLTVRRYQMNERIGGQGCANCYGKLRHDVSVMHPIGGVAYRRKVYPGRLTGAFSCGLGWWNCAVFG